MVGYGRGMASLQSFVEFDWNFRIVLNFWDYNWKELIARTEPGVRSALVGLMSA